MTCIHDYQEVVGGESEIMCMSCGTVPALEAMNINKTFADISRDMATENMDRLTTAFDSSKAAIEVRYKAIEQALISSGPEWCYTNRKQWEEQSKMTGAQINWYVLFKINHRQRHEAAVSLFERAVLV